MTLRARFQWILRMALMLFGRDQQTVVDAQREFGVRQRLWNEYARGFLPAGLAGMFRCVRGRA